MPGWSWQMMEEENKKARRRWHARVAMLCATEKPTRWLCPTGGLGHTSKCKKCMASERRVPASLRVYRPGLTVGDAVTEPGLLMITGMIALKKQGPGVVCHPQ